MSEEQITRETARDCLNSLFDKSQYLIGDGPLVRNNYRRVKEYMAQVEEENEELKRHKEEMLKVRSYIKELESEVEAKTSEEKPIKETNQENKGNSPIGGDAFPTGPVYSKETSRLVHMGGPGMSLQDYFAGKVLQGFCANAETWEMNDKSLAAMAYDLADAMLEEKKEKEKREEEKTR